MNEALMQWCVQRALDAEAKGEDIGDPARYAADLYRGVHRRCAEKAALLARLREMGAAIEPPSTARPGVLVVDFSRPTKAEADSAIAKLRAGNPDAVTQRNVVDLVFARRLDRLDRRLLVHEGTMQ